jgi:PAS domain S-box-containing protein
VDDPYPEYGPKQFYIKMVFRISSGSHRPSWNPGAERLFGYSAAEMIGQSGSCLMPPEDRQSGILEREIERVLKGQPQQDTRWMGAQRRYSLLGTMGDGTVA